MLQGELDATGPTLATLGCLTLAKRRRRLGPVTAGLAARLGLGVDPFLMAVAIGAPCDFLTPIGSRAKLLSMRSERHAARPSRRLAAALTAVVAAVGSAAIVLVWPVR